MESWHWPSRPFRPTLRLPSPSPSPSDPSGPGPSTGPSADLSSAIEVIASFVGSFEPERYSGQDAASLVSSFTRAERLCAAGKTKAAARVADSPRHSQLGHRTPAEWLASVTGESVGEANDVLRLGSTLTRHPEVDEAYREGRLSRSGAKLVADAVRVNPNREGDLLHGAEHDTLRQLRQRCLKAKAEARSQEGAEKAYAAIRANRRCRTWTDSDGAFRLDALLTPDAGASLAASLAAQSARHFEAARRSGLHESSDNYAADALVALITGVGVLHKPAATGPGSERSTGAKPTGPDPDPDPDPGPDPAAHSRPDTGIGIAIDSDTGSPAHRDGPRALVHLRVDLDALRTGKLRPFTRAWAEELVVYLAMHPNGASNEAWATALWPDRVMAPSSLHSTASVARRSLGQMADGRDHLPRSHGRLALADSVASDWARFVVLAGSADVADWRQGVELVRGRPFEGLRSSDWPVLEGIGPAIEAAVVDVSGRLAGAYLAAGDARGAEWAARKGLLVSPYDERLYRMLMRSSDLAGNPAGVEAVMAELVKLVADDIEPFDSVHPSTMELYRAADPQEDHAGRHRHHSSRPAAVAPREPSPRGSAHRQPPTRN